MVTSAQSEITTQACAELAARLGVAAETIEVVSIEDVQWRDSSLGRPQAGMMYAQVITPGYRIVLRVNHRQYVYHADNRRVLFAGEA